MNYFDVSRTVSIISDFSEIIPLTGFFYTKTLRKYPILFAYVLVLFCLNVFSFFLNSFRIHNHFVYHFIGLAELILLYVFYQRHIGLPRFFKAAFYGILAFYVLDSIFFERIFEEMNSFSRSLEALYLSLICLFTYYKIYEEERVQQIASHPFYWINSAIFFYCSASFFTFLLSSKILSNEITDFFSAGWMMSSFANIVKNIVLCVGIGITKHDE